MHEPEPLIRIAFHELESWNNILASSRHPRALSGIIAKLRKRGRDACILAARRQSGLVVQEWTEFETTETGATRSVQRTRIATPFPWPVEMRLRFWRPDARRYDVFSPATKPVVDGFVDAGLLHDDDTKHVPRTSTSFEGVDATLKLSAEARAARAAKAIGRKKGNLTPSRFWFEFYRID